jgi:hypothetical protein
MDEQIAKAIIVAGASIGVVVWLLVLRLYRKMAEAPEIERVEAIAGDKSPEEAIKAIVEKCGQFGSQVRLERPDATTLVITQAGVHMGISALRSGSKTVLRADIDDRSLRHKMQLALAAFVLLVMPITIVAVAAVLWHFAAPSATAGVRWQCVQIVQISHILWPPFVLYFVWKKMRDTAVNVVTNMMIVASA